MKKDKNYYLIGRYKEGRITDYSILEYFTMDDALEAYSEQHGCYEGDCFASVDFFGCNIHNEDISYRSIRIFKEQVKELKNKK